MHSLYFLLLNVLLLFSASQGQKYGNQFVFTEFSNAASCSETGLGVNHICANENTVQVCLDKKPLTLVPCTGTTPYCVTGKCSAKASATFQCPGVDGYYPDPADCKVFHICVQNKPTTVQCGANNVYNAITHSCVRRNNRACNIIDCRSGLVAVYPPDKSIFGVCDVTAKTVAGLGKCQKNFEMDTNSQQCKLACKTEGNLPHSTDCTMYYECFMENNGVYNFIERKCPTGSYFHTTLKHCVTGECP